MKKVVVIGSPSLHKNYQTALEKAGCSAVIFPDLSYVKKHVESFDGLLLPGGGDVSSSLSEYLPYLEDDFHGVEKNVGTDKSPDSLRPDLILTLEQLKGLHLFFEQQKPVFGICKGMQLINLYLHGTIREVADLRLHKHPEKDTFHPADNLPGSFLHALFGPHMLVNSCHHQCVDHVGQSLQTVQLAHDGTAEALSHLSCPVFGTQWHPERMPEFPGQDTLLLFRYFVSLL